MSDAMTLTGRRSDGERCILAVDDDRTVGRLISQVLSKRWSVISADSGPDALRLLESNSVDLLLTDVVMPDMDGLTLADRARERFPQLPVAFVSGCWEPSMASQASRRSPHMLMKPVDVPDLLRQVGGILEEGLSLASRGPAMSGPSVSADAGGASMAPVAIPSNGNQTMGTLLQIAHLKRTAANGLKVVVSDDALAPDIRKGDVLTVMTTAEGQLRSGDVLYCYYKDCTFARRFVRLTDSSDGFMVKMRDTVGYEDTFPWKQVIGRAVRCERLGEALVVRGVRAAGKGSWFSNLLNRFR